MNKYLSSTSMKVKKPNAVDCSAPPSTPLPHRAPPREVSFSTTSGITHSAALKYHMVSQSTGNFVAPVKKCDITDSARALWIRAYPHGLNKTTYIMASNLRKKIQSLTDLGVAEGVWDTKPSRRRNSIGRRKAQQLKLGERDQQTQEAEKNIIPVNIKTEHADEVEHEDAVGCGDEIMKHKRDEANVTEVHEDISIMGVPPHALEDYITSHKETPELLAKQHKELKTAAKAAREQTRDASRSRPIKKLSVTDCPFRLRALKMVDKYHIQMNNVREQEQRNMDAAEHYLERKARQDSIRETLEQRRKKISEWAGYHWDLIACRAEEVEHERQALQDQVALLRQQHQVNVQRETISTKTSIQTLQKFTVLDKCIKRAKNKVCKEASLATMHEELSLRQAEWASKREEHRREDMKVQAKFIAKSRMDKKKTHRLFVKVSFLHIQLNICAVLIFTLVSSKTIIMQQKKETKSLKASRNVRGGSK